MDWHWVWGGDLDGAMMAGMAGQGVFLESHETHGGHAVFESIISKDLIEGHSHPEPPKRGLR